MLKTQPTLNALLVNNLIHGKDPVDAVKAFHHIENAYGVSIRLTHTGIKVRSTYGMGKVHYEAGDVDKAIGTTQALGKDQCSAQRSFAFNFLMWASTNMPCEEVAKFVREVSGGVQ